MRDHHGFDLPEQPFDIGACDFCSDEERPRQPIVWLGETAFACDECRAKALREAS